MKLFFCVSLAVFSVTDPAFSQPSSRDSATGNSIILHEQNGIDSLLGKYIRYNETLKGVPGYRVQLFFGSHKKDAMEVKSRFLQDKKESDQEIYILYDQPYFKVRAGDFLIRMEAVKFLKEISGIFPNAFVVKDDIIVPEMKNQEKK
ncbi:MAG: SPOR domain-containing protein [Bacteroidetes bacterium]|nr:SPOR domain-containing protein [Bacteroidota bacterium]